MTLIAVREVPKPDFSATVKLLEVAIKSLPVPDHVGALTASGAAMSLSRNDCACPIHQSHVALHSALKVVRAASRARGYYR